MVRAELLRDSSKAEPMPRIAAAAGSSTTEGEDKKTDVPQATVMARTMEMGAVVTAMAVLESSQEVAERRRRDGASVAAAVANANAAAKAAANANPPGTPPWRPFQMGVALSSGDYDDTSRRRGRHGLGITAWPLPPPPRSWATAPSATSPLPGFFLFLPSFLAMGANYGTLPYFSPHM